MRIKDGFLDIPDHVERIKIDVGLSYTAPNSALWLSIDPKLFVIGIEANRHACQMMGSRVYNPHPPYEKAKITKSNYMLINCAIDNVPEPTQKLFYHTKGDPGNSSLLKPTGRLKEKHNIDVDEISEVLTLPLWYILEKIHWDRFDYIEHMKTDCQGADLRVVLSTGDYLKKIVFLDCEVATHGSYEDEVDPHIIIREIESKGFRVLKAGVNTSFVNQDLEYLVHRDGLNNYTTRK